MVRWVASGTVIVRAAVVAHPPLLVPELVVGEDADVTAVRDACLAVARALTSAAPRWLVVGAEAGGAGVLGPDAVGTFRGFGADVVVRLGEKPSETVPDAAMPLPALVAGWLRGQTGAREATVTIVEPDLSTEECRALGARIAEGPEPVGLLVAGDGSHRHGDRAPGRADHRAGPFDAAVHAALAAADPAALLAVDAGLAAELGAVGRAPWQVLAGAIEADIEADHRGWTCAEAHLLVPFGVAYHLAVLEPVA